MPRRVQEHAVATRSPPRDQHGLVDLPAGDPKPVEIGTGPFKALLAAWSLVVVVLGVAGFSLRWNYYYNFGLQNLVLQAPLTTLPIYAVEIMRNPENIVSLLWLGVQFLVPFQILLFVAKWMTRSRRQRLNSAGTLVTRFLALDSPLVVDVIRAGLIVYIAFVAGGIAGTRDFRANVVERTSALPRVTAILLGSQSGAKEAETKLPITCDTRPLKDRTPTGDPPFVGDPQMIRFLAAGAACSSEARSWRLLLRDDKFIYLFATLPDIGSRPETLVLANGDKVTLVMQ